MADLIERLRAQKSLITEERPTIAQLEAILAEDGQAVSPIQIMPDGSITASVSNFINPDGPEAADALTALQGRVERLEDHLREQITHVENRIQDGTDMGASVWRIALEDVVRENRAALDQTKGDDK